MKLLIDENLSPALAKTWQQTFPGTIHLFDAGLGGVEDPAVWEFALKNAFTIITKDSDFEHRSFLLKSPPKVIWLRVGNRSSSFINLFVLQHKDRIVAFLNDESTTLLILP